MTDDWEESFLPLNDPRAVHPPSLVPDNLPPVQCLNCDNEVSQPFYVHKQFGRAGASHLPFCDELCHELYYMKRLRGSGL